jgi:hypothetical protein
MMPRFNEAPAIHRGKCEIIPLWDYTITVLQ